MQKIEGHEHDCGRPGVNGGYIANPNVNFSRNIVSKYEIPQGFENFVKMFEEVYEN